MDTSSRKAAAAAYKKRETVAGIYAIRSAATGAIWVGHARDIEAIGNRIRFTLRTRAHSSKSLQAVFDAHGQDDLGLEELELLDAEQLAPGAERILRERAAHWRERLSAEAA